MISFDLKCACGHIFEVWFRSSADYDEQQRRSLVVCPVCFGTSVDKAVMAPNVAAKGNSRLHEPASQIPARVPAAPLVEPSIDGPAGPPVISAPAAAMPALPPEAVAMLTAIARAQAEMLPQSRWVGRRFADEARALHRAVEDGEIDSPPPIHGQASRAEAEALAEEGVAVMPLLIPVVPPEQQN